jgi:hypothetical protein
MDDYGKDFKGNIKIESVPTLPAFVSEAEDKRRLIYAEDEEKVYYGGTAAYKEAGGTSGTSGVAGTSGTSGAAGTSGTSGDSGTSGSSGNSGTSGTSGVAGTSGTSGVAGTSGTSGSSGNTGTSGTSGSSGVAGTSGTSGVAGTSGTSGVAGTSGTSGSSGNTGTSGTSGVAGTSGTSGVAGTSGTSGSSGVAGTSGTSGVAGTSGTSGVAGTSGTSGSSGAAGTSGTSGSSGAAGTSGTSGVAGTSGTSGSSGAAGTSGTSGLLGTAGTTNALTITAIRGTELAPALTEANWDTNVAGWTHAVTGGILDKSGDGTGTVSMTTPISVTAGDRIEVIATVAVSPTTSTFVAGTIALNIGGISQAIAAVGSYTFIGVATTTAGFTVTNGNASRFGINAVSIKKLTEGNLTMNGGQILAEADLVSGVPGFAFEGHTNTGIRFYRNGTEEGLEFILEGINLGGFWEDGGDGGFSTPTLSSSDPTGGTAAGWKLGSVVNNEIEVEVGGDTVKRMLVTTTSLAAGTEQIRGTTKEIFMTASHTLDAVECAGTIISNYGMSDADCELTLPTAAEGLSFVAILPTVQAHYVRFVCPSAQSDKIYLLGVAGSDDGYVGVASGYATGASASFFTFKASDGGYDWFCIPLFGTWVAG